VEFYWLLLQLTLILFFMRTENRIFLAKSSALPLTIRDWADYTNLMVFSSFHISFLSKGDDQEGEKVAISESRVLYPTL